MSTRPVFRFAPSPNGPLHLGHVFSLLVNERAAADAAGRLLLRIEDIDTTRCRPEFERAILDDCAFLGVAHERPVRRQSEHFGAHAEALSRLRAAGLVYPAFLTRGEIRARVAAAGAEGRDWPHDPDGAPLPPADDRERSAAERARLLAADRPHAIRLDMAEALARAGAGLAFEEAGEGRLPADAAAWGDVVLARKEVPTSYHLAVTVDDAAQGVTDVVRGADLKAATAVHRLLQRLLGLPEPRYHHHALVRDAAGAKLSKSDGATGLAELRAAGVTAADLRARFAADVNREAARRHS